MQGLVRTRRVAQGEVDIRVGNKARVSAFEVGTMQLQLPSRFIMELNNCYYIPALSRNIISASCLMSQGYEFNLKKIQKEAGAASADLQRSNSCFIVDPEVNLPL